MVYVLAGHSLEVAADFILGRGWSRAKGKKVLAVPSPSDLQAVGREVEQAFMEAPRSGLVALLENPLKSFELDDLLCAHKYVMEHIRCTDG